mgnify:CR=1 FL=1
MMKKNPLKVTGSIEINHRFGIICGTVASIIFGILAFIVHANSANTSAISFAFFRSLFAMIITTPFVVKNIGF